MIQNDKFEFVVYRDNFLSDSECDEWIKKLPHITSHRFEDAGHYLLEDKFEDCRSKIEPFLFG